MPGLFSPKIPLAALALLSSLPLPAQGQNKSSQPFDIKRAVGYVPSKVLGAIGFGVFFIIGALLLWRLVRNRDWWGLCLPIASFCEAIGFLLRIFIGGAKLRTSLGYYIAMDLFIVLSPAAFLAFNYIVYGRLIRMCAGPEHSYIRPAIVGRTFVISDVVTFLVQAAGGSLQVQTKSATAGKNIFLIGIIAQGISYLVYVGLVALSHRSVRRAAKNMELHNQPWYKVFTLLYFSSIFILIRSIYRVIETAQGRDGYLLTHEWCFLVLDSVPLAIAISIYVFLWPGSFIPKANSSTPFGMLPLQSTTAVS